MSAPPPPLLRSASISPRDRPRVSLTLSAAASGAILLQAETRPQQPRRLGPRCVHTSHPGLEASAQIWVILKQLSGHRHPAKHTVHCSTWLQIDRMVFLDRKSWPKWWIVVSTAAAMLCSRCTIHTKTLKWNTRVPPVQVISALSFACQ